MKQIHPSAVIEENVELGEDVLIGPGCVIQKGSSIGGGTILEANVVIGKDVKIGSGNHLFPNCTVGGPPQLLALDPDKEIGTLEIGDNNTIREQVTIHPSIYAGKKTTIGNSNLLMIGVHIGHDCTIADNIVMSNYTQMAGHCKVETGVWTSGMVVVHQFVTLGRWVYASGMAGINHDIPPFVIVSGHYPPTIRAINKRGMSRAGLNEEEVKSVFRAFKKLYRSDGMLLENAKKLAAEDGLDSNVRDMVDAILKSSQQRFGRYLEQFR